MILVSAKNTSGTLIASGSVVYQVSYPYPSNLPIIALASAASSETAEVMGMCIEDIADNSTGLVAICGNINPINTSAYSAINSKVYLSDTPGAIASTPGSLEVIVGNVKVKDSAGTINISGTISTP